MATQKSGDGVFIKKYPNRRLYNTATSRYVTLRDLAGMVRDGVEFTVVDPKGQDITRSVLAQIIVEEETKGESLLPPGFLRRLIAFYGDTAQRMLLPRYLEHSLDAFAENQDRLQAYLKNAFDSPMGNIEELSRQNMAIFEQAMRVLTPFADQSGARPEDARPRDSAPGDSPGDDRNGGDQDSGQGDEQDGGQENDPNDNPDDDQGPPTPDLAALQQQLDALQNQLNTITRTPPRPAPPDGVEPKGKGKTSGR